MGDERSEPTIEIERLRRRNAELEAAVAEHRKVVAALEESQERLRVLFELAPDAYYLNDLEGNFVDGNRAAEELIGYQREELIGKNFLRLSLLKLKDIPRAAKLLALNAVGRPTGPDTFTLTRKDGTDVAGTSIEIYNNTFRAPQTPVVIRGVPQEKCDVHHNWFLKHGDAGRAVRASGKTKVFDNVYAGKPAVAR